MSLSFDPIASWFVVVAAAVVVTVLTVWAYAQRLRGTAGRWRWVALGLRLTAVLLCVLAAMRPSVVLQEKKKQPSAIVFLLDDSTSMQITDEAGGKSRWEAASAALEKARPVAKNLGPNLDVKFYRFDSTIHEAPADASKAEPKGRETALGAAMLEAVKRLSGVQVAALVVLSDGSNNAGLDPLVQARRLRSQQVPVVAVGFGSENAGPASKDISIRDMTTGQTVFVKNRLQIRGSLAVRGFANQPIEVQLFVDDGAEPVARTRVHAPEGAETVPITGLSFIPQTAGEKKLTLKVEAKKGELNRNNNEYTTFITALAGGLNVLFVQGPSSPWEQKFWLRAVEASPDIEGELRIVRKPAQGDVGELDDAEFTPGKYNVYILSNLAAGYLTRKQQQLLTEAVENGAGLIMLGGRFSFGSGGWGDTPVARILPVNIHPGDGQLEPTGGLKFQPNTASLESFLFQVGRNREESRRIWNAMPPLTGTNRFGPPKPAANVLARTGDRSGEPVMISGEPKRGRVLAFGGETWVWARASDESRLAHRKFWRQVIFWLSHKEDQGDNKVKLTLDRRRLAVGEKLGLIATAHDAKNAPISNVEYSTTIKRESATGPSDSIRLYNERDEARGSYPAVGQPGIYEATVIARRDGKDLGKDSAHFLVYQDDRETENPAADLALLRQVAETTSGLFLPPEGLTKYLKSLNGKIYTESLTQVEHKIWDNWPFFLLFTFILTLEWWLRKRHGWV